MRLGSFGAASTPISLGVLPEANGTGGGLSGLCRMAYISDVVQQNRGDSIQPASLRGNGKARSERRKHARFPADEAVEVTLLGSGMETQCRVVDVGEEGLRIRATVPFVVEDAIQVELRDFLWIGEVRYCNEDAEDFLIGVHLYEKISREELDVLVGHYMEPALALLAG